ncbi:hypothetical protein [Halosegnis longus]|uniref:hypothetical protein n=1 Tax=Halosegnis longus TaxID=2216012 RepID=UPI00129E97C2|nr:hypothetical protein [Halosegnis longus]
MSGIWASVINEEGMTYQGESVTATNVETTHEPRIVDDGAFGDRKVLLRIAYIETEERDEPIAVTRQELHTLLGYETDVPDNIRPIEATTA